MVKKQMIDEIKQLNHTELEAILYAVLARYRALFPDWETVHLALPKNDLEVRKKYLKIMVEYLEKDKNDLP